MWAALAALGGGLILFAVAAGSPLPLAVPLCAVAAGAVVWGVVRFRAERWRRPRAAIIGAAAICALSVALFATGALALIPFAALLALTWAVALCAVAESRRKRPVAAAGRPGPLIAALGAGALVVSAITTPALASTEPGTQAVPHGTLHGHHH